MAFYITIIYNKLFIIPFKSNFYAHFVGYNHSFTKIAIHSMIK